MTENQNKIEQQGEAVRPPIVVVMGHIDHGKTKILDWYRKTKVVESESGGITQHIGAYEIIHAPLGSRTSVDPNGTADQRGKRITFIDTPGHEAFSKLRSRGARVADVAILVIAADEGVKPQTKEAIEIIKENNLPFVVAINKTDKPEANPERIKAQLAEENILVESYGGKIPSVEVSAKEGKNMDELLEVILLLAELENLTCDPEKEAEGVVIEAHIDQKRGITATLLILDGKIKKDGALVIGRSMETIRIFENFLGNPVEEAGPSSPVLVTGLSNTPSAGDAFRFFNTKPEAEQFLKTLPDEVKPEKPARMSAENESGKAVFNIILKADVMGSLEALEDMFKKLESPELAINILKSEAGDINESDVKLALATKLVTIVGFKVKPDAFSRELADRNNIHIITGEVIYELVDLAKKEMEEMIPPAIRRVDLGRAKILKVFKRDGAKQIIGGRVEEGKIKMNAKADIKRFKEAQGQGIIMELQQNKNAVKEVERGSEFGILFDSKTMIEEGDVLEIYEEEVIKRTL